MRNKVVLFRAVALLTVAVAACAPAWADVPASAGADSATAAWTPRELTFVYKGFTTKYNCDSLRGKVKDILLKLGARSDIQVRPYGCTRTASPDPLPGVTIKMNVLQPAQSGETVPAHWTTVNLVTQDPTDAAGECELIDQVRRDVLPLFATRNLQFATTCVPRQLNIGMTRLKADVLVADPRAGAPTAAR
jgi:hypothetical protein